MSTFFTNVDGEVIKLEYVVIVEPLVGSNDHSYYEVHLLGGGHITIKESFKSRASFLADWQAI